METSPIPPSCVERKRLTRSDILARQAEKKASDSVVIDKPKEDLTKNEIIESFKSEIIDSPQNEPTESPKETISGSSESPKEDLTKSEASPKSELTESKELSQSEPTPRKRLTRSDLIPVAKSKIMHQCQSCQRPANDCCPRCKMIYFCGRFCEILDEGAYGHHSRYCSHYQAISESVAHRAEVVCLEKAQNFITQYGEQLEGLIAKLAHSDQVLRINLDTKDAIESSVDDIHKIQIRNKPLSMLGSDASKPFMICSTRQFPEDSVIEKMDLVFTIVTGVRPFVFMFMESQPLAKQDKEETRVVLFINSRRCWYCQKETKTTCKECKNVPVCSDAKCLKAHTIICQDPKRTFKYQKVAEMIKKIEPTLIYSNFIRQLVQTRKTFPKGFLPKVDCDKLKAGQTDLFMEGTLMDIPGYKESTQIAMQLFDKEYNFIIILPVSTGKVKKIEILSIIFS